MKIIIVEDDKLQYETIEKSILESKLISVTKIERISTEYEFIESFEKICKHPPELILMDVMLKWTTKNKLVEPPKEIEEKGYYRAGLRCEKMLANNVKTKNTPIIIYSVLGKEDIENEITPRPQLKYVDKDFDKWGIEQAYREFNL